MRLTGNLRGGHVFLAQQTLVGFDSVADLATSGGLSTPTAFPQNYLRFGNLQTLPVLRLAR